QPKHLSAKPNGLFSYLFLCSMKNKCLNFCWKNDNIYLYKLKINKAIIMKAKVTQDFLYDYLTTRARVRVPYLIDK
ncbi:MAG: hypothetical protein IKX61_01250, partial [Prevotella sp.]|nr:hypothetical protein [Prevotella sp.]